MPDLFLVLIVVFVIIGAIAAACCSEDEPGLAVLSLIMGLFAAGGIWWHVSAYNALEWDSNVLVETFQVQTITSNDGTKYQIYIDYRSGQINNVTRRWNRIVPDGTWVDRYARQDNWAKGIRFFIPSKTRDKLRLPLNCRWDVFLEEETDDET